MKSRILLVLSMLTFNAHASILNLGTAAPFSVLGEAGVINTGPSIIFGSVAGSVGTPAVTGFPPGQVIPPGVLFLAGVGNAGPGTPFGDATAAYIVAIGLGAFNEGTASLGAGGLLSLGPGVYKFTSTTVLLNGLFQLDAMGSNSAEWVFQIPFALTTASASSVQIVNAGSAGPFTGSITWAVGGDAMLGTTTTFLGTIISNSAGDQLLTGATIGCGRAISLTASVTLDTNVVQNGCAVTSGGTVSGPSPVPEPGTFAFLLFGLMVFWLKTR
jgi:Ice-binding-like